MICLFESVCILIISILQFGLTLFGGVVPGTEVYWLINILNAFIVMGAILMTIGASVSKFLVACVGSYIVIATTIVLLLCCVGLFLWIMCDRSSFEDYITLHCKVQGVACEFHSIYTYLTSVGVVSMLFYCAFLIFSWTALRCFKYNKTINMKIKK